MLCNGPESENHFLLHFLLWIIWKCNRPTNQRANVLTGVGARDAYASKKCTVYPLWPWGKLLVISSLWRADQLSTRFSRDLFVFSPEVVWRGTWFEARPLSVREAVRHQNGWIFEKAFDPPPLSFSENHIADFATKVRDFATKVRDFATKVRMFILAGLLYIIWSYFPWDACSTTVQHG